MTGKIHEMEEFNPQTGEEDGKQPRIEVPGERKSPHKRMLQFLVIAVIVILLLCLITLIIVAYISSKKDGDSETTKEETTRKPHIVFVLADDLGHHDIGYTNPEVLTPRLDTLARTGRILTNHYMVPVCTPSRHSMMTGIYPYKAKMQHFVLANDSPHCSPLDLEFLPEKLKAAGYSSHITGKWHLGFCQWKCTPTLRGFDSWFGLYGGEGDQWSHMSIPPDIDRYDWRKNEDIYYLANGTHSTDLVTNRAIEIIRNSRNSKNSKPLFLLLAYTVPHHPLQAPQAFMNLYPEGTDPERRNILGMMSHLDYNVGRLVDTLKLEGLYDDTLLIFASDNGGDATHHQDNWPYRGGKGTLFDGGARTVSFVHGPMLKNVPTKHSGMFHVLDWHTSILAIAGGNTAGGDGIDQSDMILNGGPSRRTDFVYNIDMEQPEYFGQAAIRSGDWKLIWGFEGYIDGWGLDAVPVWEDPASMDLLGISASDTNVNEAVQFQRWAQLAQIKRFDPTDINSGWVNLFNIDSDPYEKDDLSDDPNQKSRILEMKKQILLYLEDYVAPGNASMENWTDRAKDVMVNDVWTPGWCNELDLSV